MSLEVLLTYINAFDFRKNQHILWFPVQPSETVDRLDDEITEILKEAGNNTRSTAAQTDNITVNNSTQTDSDLQTELYRTILYKTLRSVLCWLIRVCTVCMQKFPFKLEWKWNKYRNVTKFSDRQVWANSVDPDQTAPLSFRTYIVNHSVCILWIHYYVY